MAEQSQPTALGSGALLDDPLDATERGEWRGTRAREVFSANLVSAAIHVTLLLVLACWMLPLSVINVGENEIRAEVSQPVDTRIEQVAVVDRELSTATSSPKTGGQIALPVHVRSHEPVQFESVPLEVAAVSVQIPVASPLNMAEQVLTNTQTEVAELVRQADSVSGAADRILGTIARQQEQMDTLVIWMLDQSVSMQRDLDTLATSLQQPLLELQKHEVEHDHALDHIVVGFGSTTQVLVPQTRATRKVVRAIGNVPIDPSGVENVLSGIGHCIETFVEGRAKNREKKVTFVVWTDESGSDVLGLEKTIQLCKENAITVCVVGPSAVLGSQRGYHVFHHPVDRRDYYLPVDRGPDTAFPERARLPYWFREVPPDWDESKRGPAQGDMPAWYGGSNLESMLSGVSPYALTRLTRETGGQYTIFDRPGDRSPFDVEKLIPYLPDYRSADEIQDDLQSHPLRLAVLSAVEQTYRRANLTVPLLKFGNAALSGPSFHTALSQEAAQHCPRAQAAAIAVDKLLDAFGTTGMEEAYAAETSPRWRAWYDLTRGRLLAAGVRYREYCAAFQGVLQPGALQARTNYIELSPSPNLVSPESEQRAVEARRLLTRCMQQNAETPWYYLAERELADPFGVAVRQATLVPDRGRSGGGGGVRAGGSVQLPNL